MSRIRAMIRELCKFYTINFQPKVLNLSSIFTYLLLSMGRTMCQGFEKTDWGRRRHGLYRECEVRRTICSDLGSADKI